MGDGVSDLGRRGELGPREQEEYVLDGIRRGGGKMDVHKRSIFYLGNSAAIERLKQRGDIKVEESRHFSWLTLTLAELPKETKAEKGEFLVQNTRDSWEICLPAVFSRVEGITTIHELAWADREGRYFCSAIEAREVRPMPRAEDET